MIAVSDIVTRNNIHVVGSGTKTIMLAHGFGCDQGVWKYLLPELQGDYRIVLFDYVGSGRSRSSSFDPVRYNELGGYAQDVVEICQVLDLRDVHFVGHSVSGMIGLLAANDIPERFASHIMICPSPCFLNHPPDYFGGFDLPDLEELIALMEQNYLGWARYLAPLVIGSEGSQQLQEELADIFCSTDPVMAKTFARATFLSDSRELLPQVKHPSLILQSEEDALAPPSVGRYTHAQMSGSVLHVLASKGHAMHMTHPSLVGREITDWVG